MIGFTSFCRCRLIHGFNRNTDFDYAGWNYLLQVSLRSILLSGALSANKQGIMSFTLVIWQMQCCKR